MVLCLETTTPKVCSALTATTLDSKHGYPDLVTVRIIGHRCFVEKLQLQGFAELLPE